MTENLPSAEGETIFALASAPGRAGVAVIRISGPAATPAAARLGASGLKPREMALVSFRAPVDRALLDRGLAVLFPGPASFTGEDVVELSCHGNPVIAAALMAALVAAGARPARPGEFTRRAVENGRLDLIGAEGLAEVITASTVEGVALARRALDGSLGAAASALRTALLDWTAELEARLDQPGGELELAEDAVVLAGLRTAAAQARQLADSWRAVRPRLEGARVALVGPVNAGKSSLFNQLVGEARALVSPQPGTTRDAIERRIQLGSVELLLIDTAGERDGAADLEAAGLAIGRRLAGQADLRLVVLPLDRPAPPLALPPGPPTLVVGSFADRPRHPEAPAVALAFSNADGQGIPALRDALKAALCQHPVAEAGAIVVNERQYALFVEIAEACEAAAQALEGWAGPAIAAEEATAALTALAELTGEDVREAVLDRLFARFCIGK